MIMFWLWKQNPDRKRVHCQCGFVVWTNQVGRIQPPKSAWARVVVLNDRHHNDDGISHPMAEKEESSGPSALDQGCGRDVEGMWKGWLLAISIPESSSIIGGFLCKENPHAHSFILPPHSSQKAGCQGCCHQPGFLLSFLTLYEGSHICDLNLLRLLQIPV